MTYRRKSTLVSLVSASALAVGGITVGGAAPAFAEGGDLPVAQYVSSTGILNCGEDHTSGTYNGVLTADVPMTEILKGHESDMATMAGLNAYPWDETKSHIASIKYALDLPASAQIGAVTTASTSTVVPAGGITSSTSDTKVDFDMRLTDQNWAGVLSAYNTDKAKSPLPTVTLTIPYTVTANSLAEAQAADGSTIAGNGSFTFYTGRSFWSYKTTFNADTASVPYTKDLASCFTPDPDPNPNPGPAPEPAPADEPLSVKQDLTVPADLAGAEGTGAPDSEQNSVFQASGKSANLSLTGAVYPDPVKDQMAVFENQFNQSNPDFPNIALSDVSYAFKAVLTLPEGMEFMSPESITKNSVKLAGSTDFAVSKVEVADRTATVDFALTDDAKAKITTYQALKDVIDAMSSPLTVTVSGATFSQTSTPDTDYTVVGEVSGSFSALASKSAATGGRDVRFDLTWTGKQKEGLADAKTQPGITFTTRYTAPAPQPQPYEQTTDLPADMLGAESGAPDTEHDAVFVASGKNASLTLTGLVDAKTVKDQMAQAEQYYNQVSDQFGGIALSNIGFGFTASFTLPAGMSIPNSEKIPGVHLTGSDQFEVTSAIAKDGVVTVTFDMTSAAKKAITNYAALKAAVDAISPDGLQVSVPGVTFTDDSAADTNYTVKGEVSGHFNATASKSDGAKIVDFKFVWNGVQRKDPDGTDAANDEGISFTVKYKPTPTPEPTPDPAPAQSTVAGKASRAVLAVTGADTTSRVGIAAILAACGALALKRRRR